MFACLPGDIVFSKIDARNGAIGILPPEIPKAVVTSEFPVFTADDARLKGEFVKLVLRTGSFIEALRQRAIGTSGRKRITPETFKDLRIPLPPLDDQRTIVTAHRAALEHSATLEREANNIEARATTAFEKALGLEPPTPLPDRPVLAASFRDVERWGHEAILRSIAEAGKAPMSPYPIVPLGDVIADLAVGWSPRCLSRPANQDEWGVLKLSAVTSGHFEPSENKALPPTVKPRPELELKHGDVLIARGSGVTRLVGAAVFIAIEPPPKMMICDLIFRVIFNEASKIDPAFLAATLAAPDLRDQIEERRTGAAPMMQKITKSKLMSLRLPLPPKAKQAGLVASLNDARATATDLRRQAGETRAKAWANFEAAVHAADDDATAA